jgi:hypothetical protein
MLLASNDFARSLCLETLRVKVIISKQCVLPSTNVSMDNRVAFLSVRNADLKERCQSQCMYASKDGYTRFTILIVGLFAPFNNGTISILLISFYVQNSCSESER